MLGERKNFGDSRKGPEVAKRVGKDPKVPKFKDPRSSSIEQVLHFRCSTYQSPSSPRQ